MVKYREIMNKHKKLVITLSFLFIVCLQCCTFPFYNFSHSVSLPIEIVNFMVAMGICKCTGELEAEFLPDVAWKQVLLLNLVLTFLGMAARYLLEFGEVSNTHNFTYRNMLLHIVMMVMWSSASWKRRTREKKENG